MSYKLPPLKNEHVMQILAGRIDVNSPSLTTETELPINTQVGIITWQYITTNHMKIHWNTFHHITLQHDNTLNYITSHLIKTWQYIAIHYITSHYNMKIHWIALHHITLQHNNALNYITSHLIKTWQNIEIHYITSH